MATPQTYKGNGRHDWEIVNTNSMGTTTTGRLRVPGGWLYQVVTEYDGVSYTDMAFVPMPAVVKHEV